MLHYKTEIIISMSLDSRTTNESKSYLRKGDGDSSIDRDRDKREKKGELVYRRAKDWIRKTKPTMNIIEPYVYMQCKYVLYTHIEII